MRKLILLSAVLVFSLQGYSQWGITAGFDGATITGSPLRNYRYSGHIGSTYDLKLLDKWYFQPALLFTSTGCKLQNDGWVLQGGHVNIYALEIPANFSFRPAIANHTHLLVNCGLYARCGLFGNKKYIYYNDPKVNESPFDAYNRLDTGINLGVGIQVKNYSGLLTFQRGVIHAEKNGNGYNQLFRLGIGYKF